MASVAAQSQEARPSIKALAAEGDFRAIALWLNEYLVPQKIYAKVHADGPGRLGILVEFYRSPRQDRLVRFICHRIWGLNSNVIEGVHIFARPVGESNTLWEEKVRIITPALRQHHRKTPTRDHLSATPAASALPPQLRSVGKPWRSISRPSQVVTLAGKQSRSIVRKHLKLIRAFLLTGSAVASFILGCFLESLTRQRPSLPVFSQPQLSHSQPLAASSLQNGSLQNATSISFNVEDRQPQRPRPKTVNTALEPVAVIPHIRTPKPDDPTITLVFGGEVNLDNIPYDVDQDPNQLLAGVKAYQEADLAMVNLGNSLATADTTLQEKFHQHPRPEAAQVLKAGGVDIVSLTSHHTMDFGKHGLVETLETLDREGIYRVGAGRYAREARRPEIVDVKGKRIAYLGYSQEDTFAAGDDLAGVNPQKKQRVVADIQAIRNQVDWIIVNYHWEQNLPETPTDWQTNLARMAIDQGADLVIGHHPDQLQGAEIYKGRPIAYSLGDFIFGDSLHADHDTAVMKVSLQKDQMKVEFLPVIVRKSQPYLAQGKQADTILQKLEDASQIFDKPLHSPSILDVRSKLEEPDSPVAPGNSFISQPDSQSEASPDQPAATLENWGPKGESAPSTSNTTPDSMLEEGTADWSSDWKVDGFAPKVLESEPQSDPTPSLYGEPSDWPHHYDWPDEYPEEYPEEGAEEAFEPAPAESPTPALYGESSEQPSLWEPEAYYPLRSRTHSP
ncbi:MAG: CapA family protein, partial [Leptolyngbyaceae cyanobacterium MO_188.B28]|nr:CapA family protein [Leptolyngbyaceae cyanobacterium MO_188.B28]